MIYPGTAPIGNFGHDPNSLEQRKQQLLQQMASGGIRNNLSFGGSMGDAPGHAPSINFNPFLAALQGFNNGGQANNQAVSGHPFFGNGFNQGSNGAQAASVTTGAAAGSAGIGGTAGVPAAAPGPIVGNVGGVSNIQGLFQAPTGASRNLFGGNNSLTPNPLLNGAIPLMPRVGMI